MSKVVLHYSLDPEKIVLHAVRENNYKFLKKAINDGIDINICNEAEENITPLMLATVMKHYKIIRLLLEYGANVNDYIIPTEDARDEVTALDIAIENNDIIAVILLLLYSQDAIDKMVESKNPDIQKLLNIYDQKDKHLDCIREDIIKIIESEYSDICIEILKLNFAYILSNNNVDNKEYNISQNKKALSR